jgi:hypothetical protein
MRFMFSHEGPGHIWLAPMTLGVLLIALGVLLWAMPRLLEFVVAGIFVLAGCGLIGAVADAAAGQLRRMDSPWQIHEPPDDQFHA